MRNLLALWRREWSACFLSPVAYVTMVAFLLLSNWTFWNATERHVGEVESLTVLLCMSVCLWLPILITVVTMRLFSEEKRSGTIESLLTAPVTELDIVLGKYLGALSFVIIVVAPAVANIVLMKALCPGIQSLDMGGLYGGSLVLLLISGLSVSVGLLASMLTKNQIIAAICCFCGIVLPLLAGYLITLLPFGSDALVQKLLLENHIVDFARGSVDMRPLVMYISTTCFILFLAVRILESRRWR